MRATLPGPPVNVWNQLALASDNLFSTREWCECWWTHFGEGEPQILVDDAHDPHVIVPLYATGRALRRLQLIGTGPADQLGPVCAPERREQATQLLRDHLDDRRGPRWDVTVLHDVATDGGWPAELDVTEVRSVSSPVLTIGTDDWETFLASRSRSFREQVRRKHRRLLREIPGAGFRLADADSIDRDLDSFFSLHTDRWGTDAALAQGRQRRFQDEFSRRALAHGWLRLWTLEVDGAAVAASLGFRFGNAEYFYQSGRDERFDALSVGAVLMGHVVRHAVETGATEYRLLRGDEAYKSRWSDLDRSVRTLAISRTLRGAAAVRWAARRAG